MTHYEGTCDVCGETITLDIDEREQIDVGITDDGQVYTWARHYATAPPEANPDCAVYSSRVYRDKPESASSASP